MFVDVPPEEEEAVADEVGRVSAEAGGEGTGQVGLGPGERVGVEDVQVAEMLVPRVTPEQDQAVAHHGHRVGVARLCGCGCAWLCCGDWGAVDVRWMEG
jgi:hypothetical protein